MQNGKRYGCKRSFTSLCTYITGRFFIKKKSNSMNDRPSSFLQKYMFCNLCAPKNVSQPFLRNIRFVFWKQKYYKVILSVERAFCNLREESISDSYKAQTVVALRLIYFVQRQYMQQMSKKFSYITRQFCLVIKNDKHDT